MWDRPSPLVVCPVRARALLKLRSVDCTGTIIRAMRFFLTVLLSIAAVPVWSQSPAPTEFFEKKIRPLLVANCQACHNSKMKSAGLDLGTAEGFQHGGQNGPVVVEGNPEASRLLKVIGYSESIKMPPTGKPKLQELADLPTRVNM